MIPIKTMNAVCVGPEDKFEFGIEHQDIMEDVSVVIQAKNWDEAVKKFKKFQKLMKTKRVYIK